MGFLAQAVGSMQQSSAYKTMAGMYAGQGDMNRQLGDMSADTALQSGEQAAGQVQRKASQDIGAQTAGYASSGVDTSSGSPLDLMADTRMFSTYDQSNLRLNAARQAFGYRVQGIRSQQQGYMQALGAQQQSTNAGLQAGGDLLQGFASTALTANNLLNPSSPKTYSI